MKSFSLLYVLCRLTLIQIYIITLHLNFWLIFNKILKNGCNKISIFKLLLFLVELLESNSWLGWSRCKVNWFARREYRFQIHYNNHPSRDTATNVWMKNFDYSGTKFCWSNYNTTFITISIKTLYLFTHHITTNTLTLIFIFGVANTST